MQARGIDKPEAVTHRLGVVRDPFPGHGRFAGWIAIPYLNKDRKPLSMRFRCPVEHNHREVHNGGKYMSLTDEPSRIYNIGAVHRAKDVIHVTEGEFDAMVLEKVGLPAIAIAGAQGWLPHYRRVLAGFNKVYVWGDPDDAGAEFTRKVTQSVRQAQGVRLLTGDVTDTYIKGGASALLGLIGR